MDLGINLSVHTKLVIIVHELASSLLIQARLGEGNDQKAANDLKNVLQRPLGWVPVALQGVHADFARVLSDVRMVYLRQKETFRGAHREATFND